VGHLEDLLAVQDHDTRVDQLRHQRSNVPELSIAADLRKSIERVDAERSAVTVELDDVRRREQRLEDEAATVQAKAADAERRLYDGSVVAHRELEDLQEDHRLLRARQGQLEEQAIELMEVAEPLAAEVARLDAERAEHQARLADVEAVIAVAWSEIDAQIAVEDAGRKVAASTVDEGTLRDYESLRLRHGGTGAARLNGARCEGCHLQIPPAELDAIKRSPEGTTVFCPQCGRILVR
jgi:predicted  nucleic acid-binding Zn-ribbon protein